MAGRYVKFCFIRIEIGTRGFSSPLITNLYSKFWNSKWWIQYGGSKYQHLLDSDENCYSEVVEMADYKRLREILTFKMADPF